MAFCVLGKNGFHLSLGGQKGLCAPSTVGGDNLLAVLVDPHAVGVLEVHAPAITIPALDLAEVFGLLARLALSNLGARRLNLLTAGRAGGVAIKDRSRAPDLVAEDTGHFVCLTSCSGGRQGDLPTRPAGIQFFFRWSSKSLGSLHGLCEEA